MASKYPPDTPRPSDVNRDEVENSQNASTDQDHLKASEQDQKDFVRNIDWASF